MANESPANLRNRAESDQATAIARNQLAGDIGKAGTKGTRVPWTGADPTVNVAMPPRATSGK